MNAEVSSRIFVKLCEGSTSMDPVASHAGSGRSERFVVFDRVGGVSYERIGTTV